VQFESEEKSSTDNVQLDDVSVTRSVALGRSSSDNISQFPDDDDDLFLAVGSGSGSQNLSDETFCDCPDPIDTYKSKIIHRFNRYSIGKLITEKTGAENRFREQVVRYHIRNEKTLQWTKLLLRDSW